ncbi:electron transfer flavoprotein subunit beta/FixA family protein [Dissulfurirhabdus thermomarina]|uniref:Electron transfer flavoprotein subunit beta/FixA family protein n=1 Tax=Dissulfurirhabdus thermomarina TaxID=1765737 RepID=A0A6N9TQ01_DISTH|nr:electron transfer flavoprotein subunit beta/FixA family protein [Dissulfurirhabdus thermomarina]NDY42183.1 electron transfer flavoprotein subunit beta/FixA family protein [Dissulfurirhabdus thermomarina]NMX22523.1 electron transfer flavoprotein subunit beta/FixA family protein [Dissulfurirhabdus thermomarina]
MKIVVCIKQVPDEKTVRFDPEKGTLIREGTAAVINPLDLHALEAGVQLREAVGGEVIAVSMGPPQAEEALREAISRGADRGVLLSDRAFAGADTLATTYALHLAVGRLGPVDVVLCGRQTSDGDTAQVGPGLAARMDVPCVAGVTRVEPVDGGAALRVHRPREGGYDVVQVRLPCVLTVAAELNSPRVPSLKGKMAAKKAEIPVWTGADLGADPGRLGMAGSPTRVVETFVPSFDARREMLEGSPEAQVEALLERLRAAGVLAR